MPGWGTSSWGLGGWGSGDYANLYILYAEALNERTVRVYLSRPAKAVSPIIVGDAYNPQTWSVTRGDTNAAIRVMGVSTTSNASVVDLYLLGKLGNVLTTHTVSAQTLVDGNGALIVLPYTANFVGCEAVVEAETPDSVTDFANPPFENEDGTLAGTLKIGTDGDYAMDTGVVLLKKLIIRRLTTTPGGFFHLSPDYGLGIRVKEPMKTTDLVKLKAEIESQVQNEPEIGACQAILTIDNKGILSIEIRAELKKTNQKIVVPIKANISLTAF